MVRILILGGAGFIGYHLLNRLLQNDDNEITLVDNLSRGKLDTELESALNVGARVKFIDADLTDLGSFARIGTQYDLVYLLAGIVGVRNVVHSPAHVIHTNTSIILNTLQWLRHSGCNRLMFASTSEVYAGSIEVGISHIPTSEDVPVTICDTQEPRFSYAISKILGESAVKHYSLEYGFEAVIVRFHNIYGPRMGFDHVIPELMQRIFNERDPFPVFGLDQTRAFCYVSDAVDAMIQLMGCQLESDLVVHIGNSDEEILIKDLLSKLMTLTGFNPEIEAFPAPVGAVDRRCPDTQKLHRLTGYYPKINLDKGLALTWDWYKERLKLEASKIP